MMSKVEINVMTHPLDFGIHKGKLLGEVGDDYLNWIYIMAEERPHTFIGRNWQPEIRWEVTRRNEERMRSGDWQRKAIPYNRDEILQNVAVADTVFPPRDPLPRGGIVKNPLDNKSEHCGPPRRPFGPTAKVPINPIFQMPNLNLQEAPAEGDQVDLLVDSGWNNMSVAVTNVLVDMASIVLWKQFDKRVDKKVGFCRWMMDVSEEALNYGKVVKETMLHEPSRHKSVPERTTTYSYLGALFEYEEDRQGERPRLVRVL